MYRYTLPSVAVAFFLMVIGGCTETSVSGLQKAPDEQATAEEQALAVKEAVKAGVDEALKASQRQEAAQKRDRGLHPLVRDLAVARELLARAQQTDDKGALQGYLDRLQHVLTAMLAETPASMLTTHIERAEFAITVQQPTEEQFSDASAEMLLAHEESFSVQPPGLLPGVLTKLEAAKMKLDEGDAATARQLLEEAREVASGHSINGFLRDAAAAVDGAGAALERGAMSVVKAELEEAAGKLEEVAKVAGVQPEPAPATEETAGVEGGQAPAGSAATETGAPGTAEGATAPGPTGTTGAAGAAGTAAPAGTTQGTGATGAQQPAPAAGSTTVAPPPAPSR